MDKMALLRTEQAFPFVDYMMSAGMPVEKYLEQAGLPLSLVDHSDGVILEKQLWQLLDIVSEQEDLQDFGLRVGNGIDIEQLLAGMMPRLMVQPTLLGLIQAFCLMVNEESSDAQFWLIPSDNSERHWFCRSGVPGIAVGERDAELYTLTLMIKMARLIAGPDWQPDCIRLKTLDNQALHHWGIFQGNEIKLGHDFTAIEVPSYMVNTQFFGELTNVGITTAQTDNDTPRSLPNDHFPEALKQVLSLYLNDENLDLNHAAQLLGVSARTLQRQLAKENTSYAQLIDIIRFNSALPLLKDDNVKLVDIAYDLGYSDPAHFSRAFKRWAGVSPREYRRTLAA